MFSAGSFTIWAAILRHLPIATSVFASGASSAALWAASKSWYNAVIDFRTSAIPLTAPNAAGNRIVCPCSAASLMERVAA
jgi:hypothetical protein